MTGLREWVTGWRTDLSVAFRVLSRNPGFTVVAVGTLAVGIGANASVLSLATGVLLTAPPYDRPEELLLVWNTLPGSSDRLPVAGPDAAILEERSSRLSQVAFTMRGVDGAIESAAGDGAEHVRLAAVTPNFFDVLGVDASLGRRLDPTGVAAAVDVQRAVISYELWERLFASDPEVVGQGVLINGVQAEVMGVMPADFSLVLPPESGVTTDIDVWMALSVPLSDFHRSDGNPIDRDSDNTGIVVARLAPDATLDQAAAEVSRIGSDLRAVVPGYETSGLGLEARALLGDATAHARPPLIALLVGVVGVLLVACLNISTLLLARGVGRRQEFAVRAALGGGRRHLVRHLLVENGVLVGLGFVAAVILAWTALPLLTPLVPPELMPRDGVSLDPRTVVAATAIAALVVLLFGLIPAVEASHREARMVVGRSMGRGQARTLGQMRSALVGGQIALSLVLVLGAGLMHRTVRALEGVRPGFEVEDALTFRISLRVPTRYQSPAYRAEVMDRISATLADMPGVSAVGLVGVLPLGGDRWSQPYGLPGQSEDDWQQNRADFQMITSGYFDAIGARLLEGRPFTPQEDLVEDERVVVVDDRLARRIAPEGSAIDAVIGVPLDGKPVEARVVGVVEHIRHERLDADGREAIYVPYRQEASRDVAFIVRGVHDAEALTADIVRAVHALDPQIPVYEIRTMEAYVAEAVAPRRFVRSLLLGFAVLTLLCAALGLYGTIAFDVRRRTREIGIRLAVGATPHEVVGSVLRGVAFVSALGVVGGLLLAGVLGPALRSQLYGVDLGDPTSWVVAVIVVGAASLVAGWVPAWRVTSVDPTRSLTSD